MKQDADGVVTADNAFDKALSPAADGDTTLFKNIYTENDSYAGVLFTLDNSYFCEKLTIYSGFEGMEDIYRVYAGEDLDSLYRTKNRITDSISVGGVDPVEIVCSKKVKYIAFFCIGYDGNQRIKEFEAWGKAEPKEEIKVNTDSLYVEGNRILSDGQILNLQGVNITELSWSPYGDGSTEEGESDADHSLRRALEDWNCRIIRLAVNPDFYINGGVYKEQLRTAEQYRNTVDSFITEITEAGVAVILDCHAYYGVTDTVLDFWKLAAPKYDGNAFVMYGLLNEPVSDWKTYYEGGITTTVEGEKIQVVGMTELLELVRSYSDNIAVIGGIDWAFDLSCVTENDLRAFAATRTEATGLSVDEYTKKYFLGASERLGNGIVFDTHPYSNKPTDWDNYLANAMDAYPVLFGEYGPADNSGVITNLTDAEQVYLENTFGYIRSHGLSSTAWGMSAWPFLTQTNGNVTPFGEAVKEFIANEK